MGVFFFAIEFFGERVFEVGFFFSENIRNQAGDAVENDHGGEFASGEDIVSD